MLRLLTACFFSVITIVSSRAQPVFKSITLEEALAQAGIQNKLLFVQVRSNDCDICNQVADAAFEKALLLETLDAEFVCMVVSQNDKQWRTFHDRYNTRNGGVSLFIDKLGTLVHRYNSTTSNVNTYLANIDMAKRKLYKAAIYRNLEEDFKGGNRQPSFIETYLVTRQNLGLETDSLLNEYASSLSPDSATSRRVLLFIARMAPALASTSDKVLRRNISLFNQTWMSMEQSERVTINNNIIRKSRQVAISTRDLNAAYRVATFAGSTHYDITSAQKAYDKNMLDFYREINDTVQYLADATRYYDTYYMTIPVDSIKQVDSIKSRQLSTVPKGDAIPGSTNSSATRRSIIFSASSQIYTNQLSAAAKSFYQFSKDFVHLKKALEWAKRACEFYDTPDAMDIYARILFRLGNEEEAIAWEGKAIETGKKRGIHSREREEVLNKMKNRDKLID